MRAMRTHIHTTLRMRKTVLSSSRYGRGNFFLKFSSFSLSLFSLTSISAAPLRVGKIEGTDRLKGVEEKVLLRSQTKSRCCCCPSLICECLLCACILHSRIALICIFRVRLLPLRELGKKRKQTSDRIIVFLWNRGFELERILTKKRRKRKKKRGKFQGAGFIFIFIVSVLYMW